MYNQFNPFNPFATSNWPAFGNAGGNGPWPATTFNPAFPWNANTPWFNSNSTPWTGTPGAATPSNNFWTTPSFNGPWANATPWAATPWNSTPWNVTPWANGFFGATTPWFNAPSAFNTVNPWTNAAFTPWNTTPVTNPSNQWTNNWPNAFTPWAAPFTNPFVPSFTNNSPVFQGNFGPTWTPTNFNQGTFPFNANTTTGNPVTIDGSDRTGRRGVNFARDAA